MAWRRHPLWPGLKLVLHLKVLSSFLSRLYVTVGQFIYSTPFPLLFSAPCPTTRAKTAAVYETQHTCDQDSITRANYKRKITNGFGAKKSPRSRIGCHSRYAPFKIWFLTFYLVEEPPKQPISKRVCRTPPQMSETPIEVKIANALPKVIGGSLLLVLCIYLSLSGSIMPQIETTEHHSESALSSSETKVESSSAQQLYEVYYQINQVFTDQCYNSWEGNWPRLQVEELELGGHNLADIIDEMSKHNRAFIMYDESGEIVTEKWVTFFRSINYVIQEKCKKRDTYNRSSWKTQLDILQDKTNGDRQFTHYRHGFSGPCRGCNQ